MTIHTFKFNAAVLANSIVNFTVGFMRITTHDGTEEATPAGSGVLVTLESAHGILTAAHVLENLSVRDKIGNVRFTDAARAIRRQTVDVADTQRLVLAASTGSPEGPDLGFLLLPHRMVEALKATNVFLNLGRIRGSALDSKQPPPPYFDAVAGVVAERTTRRSSPSSSWALEIGVVAQFCDGKVLREYESKGCDLIEFEPGHGSETSLPGSYQGMSGAGLWRFYVSPDGSVRETRLHGIAFYESPPSDGRRTIICHGPRSLFDLLYSKMIEKWPKYAD